MASKVTFGVKLPISQKKGEEKGGGTWELFNRPGLEFGMYTSAHIPLEVTWSPLEIPWSCDQTCLEGCLGNVVCVSQEERSLVCSWWSPPLCPMIFLTQFIVVPMQWL